MDEPAGGTLPDIRGMYWGLALVALATLMLQVALTRIFSVTMWYHMSLVSVSMAMFGMTLGALVVHWFPKAFTTELAASKAALFGLGFGLTTAGCLAICLNIPLAMELTAGGIGMFLLWNAVAALPFVFSGVCVCVCLTRYPTKVSRLYAFDLAGASLGCLLVVWLLGQVDAVSAILFIAAVPTLGAVGFSHSAGSKGLSTVSLVLTLGFLVAGFHNTSAKWLGIRYVLGKPYSTETTVHDEWNVFSHITVREEHGDLYWGAGAKAPKTKDVETDYLVLHMDTRASSPLLRLGDNWDDLEWLMYDATNLMHTLRDDGHVLVIGAGGGRDILSALIPSKGKRKVSAVEINPVTCALHTKYFKDFTKILTLENVELYNDEARSWVERSQEKFQVITIPLVDTSAASAAGAFALTENSLYTVEAFKLFYSRLDDDGVLSVSRFWFGGSKGEAHRLVVTGAEALRQLGIKSPREHMYVARGSRLTNLLISKEPFTEQDLATLKAACEKYGFDELVTPVAGIEATLAAAVDDPQWAEKNEEGLIKVELTAPTDNKPYFFHSYSMSNLLSPASWVSARQPGVASWDREAMIVLASLVIAVTVLSLAVVGVPLWVEWGGRQLSAGDLIPNLGFFSLIGFGFMMFESAQMQRLSIFLGYPIYALTVVLFGLLLSSSLGASLVGKMLERGVAGAVKSASIGLLAVLVLCGLLTPSLQSWAAASSTPVRVLASLLMIAPAGLFLGMLFPLGLHLTEKAGKVSLAWCWAVNGVASTCAAVYGIALSISFGIGFTYWMGLACYIGACALCVRMAR